MAEATYDLVVIGSGSAGSGPATICREAGWTVAVVDDAPLGGTCALRGCDPKKVLVGGAHTLEQHRRFQARGIFTSQIDLDWPALMAFKRSFTEPVPNNRAESFHAAGIDTYHGTAVFLNENTLQVGADTLRARKIVLANGAKPIALDIPGAEVVIDSTEFLELDRLPPRILFIGGGYISFEFAHIAARAGSQVQILHRSSQPLGQFDADLVSALVESTRQAGLLVRLNTEVRTIEARAGAFHVYAESHGKAAEFDADLVVHGAGRVPALAGMNLDAAGVEATRRGVVVNEFLQSVSNPDVYAAGDVAASGPPLTPVAGMEGRIVAQNLLHGNRAEPDYRAIPSVVFTIPALARVGMSESEARAEGRSVRVNHLDTTEWYSSRRLNIAKSAAKIIVDENNDTILGAHLFGPEAEELINLFALAIRFEIPAAELKRTIYAYPSAGSDLVYMV